MSNPPGIPYGGLANSLQVAPSGVTAVVFPTVLELFTDFSISVRYFNASGSSQATTGSMSSGANSLVLSNALDFANGQGISVTGAGPGGATLITSIVSGARTTSLILSAAAGTTVSGTAVIHDDSAALQAAINYVVSAGGGRIFCPEGIYNIGNAPTTGGGGAYHLSIPHNAVTNNPIAILIEGAFNNGGYPELSSQVAMTGVILNFIAPATVAHEIAIAGYTQAPGTFSYVNLTMRNITVRTPYSNSLPFSYTALDCLWTANLELENVVFDTPYGTQVDDVPNTGYSNGVICPGVSNYGCVRLKNVFIACFCYCLIHSEHAVLDEVFIQSGRYALVQNAGFHNAVYERVLIQECIWLILSQGACPCIGNIDVEYQTTGGGTFQGIVSGTAAVGELHYNSVVAGTGIVDMVGAGYANNSPALKLINDSGAREPPKPITVAASPYTYTATKSGSVYVSGGTVSSVSLTRRGVSVPTGIVSGCVEVATGDSVVVTYSAVPTMNFVP